MSILGGFLVALCCWLLGRAILPSRKALPRGLYEEQGIAFLLGAAGIMAAAMGLTWIGVELTTPVAWLLLVAAGAAGAFRLSRQQQQEDPPAPSAFAGWQLALLLVLGLGAAAVSLSHPLNNFDALFHFAYKAKVLYFTGDIRDSAFTGMVGPDGQPLHFGRVMTHPAYPLGIPFLEALAAHAGFGWSDRWVQLPLAFWALCLPAAVAFGLRGFGVRAVRWGAILAAATPALYIRDYLAPGTAPFTAEVGLRDNVTPNLPADLPVAALLAAACALWIRAQKERSRCAALCAGLCLAGAALAKNEGLGLAVVFAASTLVATLLSFRRQVLAATGTTLGLALLLLVPWLLHRASLPAIDEDYAGRLTLTNVQELATAPVAVSAASSEQVRNDPDLLASPPPRGEVALHMLLDELAPWRTWYNWGALWLLAALGVLAAFQPGRPEAVACILLVLGGLLLYYAVLVVSPWYLPDLLVAGIPDRLILHLVGPAVLFVALAFWARPPSPAEEGALQP